MESHGATNERGAGGVHPADRRGARRGRRRRARHDHRGHRHHHEGEGTPNRRGQVSGPLQNLQRRLLRLRDRTRSILCLTRPARDLIAAANADTASPNTSTARAIASSVGWTAITLPCAFRNLTCRAAPAPLARGASGSDVRAGARLRVGARSATHRAPEVVLRDFRDRRPAAPARAADRRHDRFCTWTPWRSARLGRTR